MRFAPYIQKIISGLIFYFIIFSGYFLTSAAFGWTHDGDLKITEQSELNAIAANLENITGSLSISGSSINDLSKLSALTSIQGKLSISSCSSLSSLSGLNALKSVGGNLSISQCGELKNLKGLDSLVSVNDMFSLWNNYKLESLEGLALQSVRRIGIAEQYALTNIDALLTLSKPIEYIELYVNPLIENLDGFANIPYSNRLLIAGNSALTSFCGIHKSALYAPYPTQFTIIGNGENPSRSDIIYQCSEPNRRVYFTAFYDENGDGLVNQGERGLKNITIRIQSFFTKAKHLTNHNGECSFNSQVEGTYKVFPLQSTLPPNTLFSTPDTFSIHLINKFQQEHVYCGIQGDDLEDWLGKPVIVPEPEANSNVEANALVLINGSPTYPHVKYNYSWENATDGSYNANTGTTWAASGSETPWAIFEFADQGIYQFDYIKFQMENGQSSKLAYPASEIQIFTSTTDIALTSFTSLGKFRCTYGTTQMQWCRLDKEVKAKYIKLKLLSPATLDRYIQLVEFSVDTHNKQGAEPAQKSSAIRRIKTGLINYPNPFNPSTNISYNLDTDADISIKIFDLTGKTVANLLDSHKVAGHYTITWNAGHLPSGVYFIYMQTGSIKYSKRILLMR